MGPKKGKSSEEKREALLKIYHESKQPFNLKEIEKAGASAGVVQQAIKDINQSLVDDKLIQSDKIGSGVFFWAFPSKALQDRLARKEALDEALKQSQTNIAKLTEAKTHAQEGRNGPDRASKLSCLDALQEEAKALTAIIEANQQNDPEEVRRIEDIANKNKESANRWVDNTYAVKSYLTKKKGMPSREVDKHLGIDDHFDYFDDEMMQQKAKKMRK